MGYEYPSYGKAKPFVPASIEFPKKKAKQLQKMIEDLPLSTAQEAIAKALGWEDWFHLSAAIKEGREPSQPDEAIEDDERNKRWDTQFNAIHDELNLRLPDPEWIVAELGLTCSAATAKKRAAEVGPWGAYQQPPEEVAPGILFGQCAKFHCYRLSPERQARIREEWRLDCDGWYMADDHDWRVILSFPDVFGEGERQAAQERMREHHPSLYEFLTGKDSGYSQRNGSIKKRKEWAAASPDSLFAISIFEDWTFPKSSTQHEICVVSAVRGRDLIRLIDTHGVWPIDGSIPVCWFAIQTADVRKILSRADIFGRAQNCISGLPGYEHQPVCATPYKRWVFDDDELSLAISNGYTSLVDAIAPGTFNLIP